MKIVRNEIIQFLYNQAYVIVSTVDKRGFPHSSCKGIVKIDRNGRIYLLDLYRTLTYENLRSNPHINVTAVDEHKFIGYCLKGKIKSFSEEELPKDILRAWEERITSRLTQRLLRNVHGEKGHARHPEILLPKPEYLIVMDVEEIIDLTPHHLK